MFQNPKLLKESCTKYLPGLNVIRQDRLVQVPSGNIIIFKKNQNVWLIFLGSWYNLLENMFQMQNLVFNLLFEAFVKGK